MKHLIEQKMRWTPLTEESADELIDHNWYLLASKNHGTALKARYNDDLPHFEILVTKGFSAQIECVYCWDWAKYGLTHYMDMPLLPWELEEIVHGCQQTDEELPFVEVKDE